MKKFIQKLGVLLMILTFSVTLNGNRNDVQIFAKSKIEISKKVLKLKVGQSYTIKIKGKKKKVKWSSSNKKIVVVNKKGKVLAKKAGKAVIIAKIQKKKYKCKVIVINQKKVNRKEDNKQEIIPVNKIILNNTNIICTKDDQIDLKATVTPINATNRKIIWASSDDNVASVIDEKVVIKKIGKCDIIASCGGIKAVCHIKIKNKVEAINILEEEINIYRGESYEIKCSLTPSDALVDADVVYSTSDKNIAEVVNGKIIGKNVGESELVVQYKNLIKKCIIKVNKNKEDLIADENERYSKKISDEKVRKDAIIKSSQEKIDELRREGYYKGTYADHNTEKSKLVKNKQNLEMQRSALEGVEGSYAATKRMQLDSDIAKIEDKIENLEKLYSNKVQIDGMYDFMEKINNDYSKFLTKSEVDHEKRLKEIENMF